MKRAMTTVAATAAGAVLCVLALAGCGAAHRHANGSDGPGAIVGSTAAAPAAGGQGGAGQAAEPAATDTGTAQLDQDLAQIQSQLGGLDTEAAKADQSPQDGDGN